MRVARASGDSEIVAGVTPKSPSIMACQSFRDIVYKFLKETPADANELANLQVA
ncbi:MAG: hypothetical protein KME32_11000 [Mojavia pulchra JT2-VF2]|uniref:Uncharacterized protein n=1 Tax=Mojavia pulchra JT2-VF2 TaxID=287848 RepID=A0A951UFL4_9NOST|nr:hypothetical protein [Mojavia pulchra JT2-VF2]